MSKTSEQKNIKSFTIDDKELESLVNKYLDYEQREEHRQFIINLIGRNDLELLTKLIKKRLTFGTAGIRGSMGAGFGQMNDLVIIQTSQGLASYLLEFNKEESMKKGVVIGNDARHNSSRFARLVALAFLQKEIPVYFCEHIIPTPLVSFGVGFYEAAAGVVVTASHNPKSDNGYKVYWSNGAQILSPHDSEIQRHIMMDENQKPWPKAWQEDLLINCAQNQPSTTIPKDWKFTKIHKDLSANYFNYIDSMISDPERNRSVDICITYTTMHGVGHNFLSRALEIAGFDNTFPVESQKKPDPEFPTVKFPNPEEAGALDLAFETAKHANSTLILANDPDADRCAAALYNPKSGNQRVFNGNEIGSLLGWWLWHSFINVSEQNATVSVSEDEAENVNTNNEEQFKSAATLTKNHEPTDCYMISTAVSSKFLSSMAKIEGFNFIETLTGFKYMGNLAYKLIHEQQKRVLFAYEEAIGYMVDSRVLDKDGISAAIQLAQCAAYISKNYNKRTLEQHLDWLYFVYGYHYNLNSYYICSDQNTIQKIFRNIQSNYPKSFGEKFKVTRIRDLNNNFDSGTHDKKCTLPTSSSSFMVTFFINDNISITLRTSGTEPKIKYYSEIFKKLPPLEKSSNNLDSTSIINLYDENQLLAKEEARYELSQLVHLVVEHCLQPNHYELEPAASG